MISINMRMISVSLALLALAAGLGQQPVMANSLGFGGALGAPGTIMGGALNAIPDMVNSASNMMTGIATPMANAMGPLASGLSGMLSNTMGGLGTIAGGRNGLLGNTLRLGVGSMSGITSGLGNGLSGLATANGVSSLAAPNQQATVSSPNGLGNPYRVVGPHAPAAAAVGASMLRNNYKREAIAEGAMMGAANEMMGAASQMMAGANTAALAGAAAESAVGAATGEGELIAGAPGASGASGPLASSRGETVVGPASSLVSRQALTAEAIRNAKAESAQAGAEMVQHGAINARSASMASNAYRQAKLAGARDRVNIAGTIQNSARISDAAIATHDTATKAEDSLLGSELAVDSAATVFDSDGAYIPPVTVSLLRSLPYGRLGLRNIIPRPLTHPSPMLPDVWLNGMPVNYQDVPLRMPPYLVGPAQTVNSLMGSHVASANGATINGQPFISNNGVILNGLLFDPAYAYLTGGFNELIGSSLMPILANGQLEAQDEVALANLLNMHLFNGLGTYHGYGRLNPVPMITGSVSDVNIMPTTTIGTTYPIGSALVIEPRDSFFQDYTDSASSRQNFDERQQQP